MTTITGAVGWPGSLKRERSLSWMPDFGNEASPPGLDGTRQYRNSNGGGLWRANYNKVQLRNQEHRLAWQVLEIKLRGGMMPVNVPLLFCGQPTGGIFVHDTVMAARDVSGLVDARSLDAELVEGMHFSDYDADTYGWRMYRIVSVVNPGGGMRNITFWPPLRFAAAIDHQFETDIPRCVMRLAQSDSMDAEFDMRIRADPSVSFVEAF